ncbi:hypothetical protein Tco_0757377 [Tanacetum coccineum]
MFETPSPPPQPPPQPPLMGHPIFFNVLDYHGAHYEYIDSTFARFNTITTSLKDIDEGYSSKNYVRKFLRALHPKWRTKVTTIEESKDLTSLSLDELIGNLKVHELIIKKYFEIVKGKGERRSLALKAKMESSDEESSTSGSEDEEYAMPVRDFKRRGRCEDLNHLIEECPKPPRDKNQRAFVGGSWSDSGKEGDEKAKDETCLIAQASSEVQRIENKAKTGLCLAQRLCHLASTLDVPSSILAGGYYPLNAASAATSAVTWCHVATVDPPLMSRVRSDKFT